MRSTVILPKKESKNKNPHPYQSREWYQFNGRIGGKKRAQMAGFREHQIRAGKRSAEVNDMAEIGRRGARVTLRRYGYTKLFHHCRNWRLANPSGPERQVMEILEELRAPYEREAMILGPWIPLSVDFYLPDRNDSIIEVYGRVHYDPLFDHPNKPETRRMLDERRLSRLAKEGFRPLVVSHAELRSPEARHNIITFLMG